MRLRWNGSAVRDRFAKGWTSRRGVRYAAVLVVLVALPSLGLDDFRLRILTLAWLASTLTVGVTVSLGYAGLPNLSQATFYGVGAYATAILVDKGLAFELAGVAAVLLSASVGALVSLTTTRIRGYYWALISLAFSQVGFVIFNNWKSLTRGADGFLVPIVSFFGAPITTPAAYYYMSLGVLVVSFVAATNLTRFFVGRAMLAMSQDEPAAAMMGISASTFKFIAMTFSAAIGGLAGAAFSAVSVIITPNRFNFLESFTIVLFAIVGGSTSLLGGVMAATALIYLTESFRFLFDYRQFIYGTAVIVAVMLRVGVFASVANPIRTRLGRSAVRRILPASGDRSTTT